MYDKKEHTKFKTSVEKHIESFVEYIKNPCKYHSVSVMDMIKEMEDENDLLRILEEDKRRNVTISCERRIRVINSVIDPVLALSRYYGKTINKNELKQNLKGDEKYIDYIAKKYKESRDRNASLKKGYKPEISPNIRLFNIKWGKDIKLNKSMYISAEVSQAIERGTTK